MISLDRQLSIWKTVCIPIIGPTVDCPQNISSKWNFLPNPTLDPQTIKILPLLPQSHSVEEPMMADLIRWTCNQKKSLWNSSLNYDLDEEALGASTFPWPLKILKWSFFSRGGCTWRDVHKPSQILEILCKKWRLPDPIFGETTIKVGPCLFYCDVACKNFSYLKPSK